MEGTSRLPLLLVWFLCPFVYFLLFLLSSAKIIITTASSNMPQAHVEVRLKDADAGEYITRAEVGPSRYFPTRKLITSRSRTHSILF